MKIKIETAAHEIISRDIIVMQENNNFVCGKDAAGKLIIISRKKIINYNSCGKDLNTMGA